MTVDMDEGNTLIGWFLVGGGGASDGRAYAGAYRPDVRIDYGAPTMRNVEWAFNQIWGIETRKLLRTLSDYVMITLLLPWSLR